MISEADAVVIGAGALGTSLAFHLAEYGMRRVLLLDRFDAGTQTSARAAGLFKQIQADPTRTLLARLSVNKLLNFEQETGVPCPAIRSGSLLVSRTPEHAALIEREASNSRNWGVDLEMVDPATAHRLMPMLEPDGLLAACYTPGDIYIEEPTSLLNAYREAAIRLDVEVLSNTPATGVQFEQGQVTGVMTHKGRIASPIAIDAAGAWARWVGETARVNVPVAPVRHQLYITHPIVGVEEEFPIVRFADSAVYVRAARGGLMLGGFESDPLAMDPRREREDFSMDALPLDRRVLERQTASVENQMPALQDVQIAEHRGGCFTMTIDGRFLAGPAPELNGFWMATGCNGTGFSLSPAIGQVLAEWIVGGAPSIDISSLTPARFADAALTDEALTAGGVWQYAHYYDPEQ